jgi:GR25 family glycosyltransferase involved in LPS biosynthesis
MEVKLSSTDYTYNNFEEINEYPKTFQELLDAPCRVINLDHNTTRWNASEERIREAGFTNITRVSAVNAKNDEELYNGWKSLGFPKFAYKYDIGFLTNIGIQGCFLSHFKIWKEIIDNKIPYMVVFEDDVLFHPNWTVLAPAYFEKTPQNYDMVYMGNRNDNVITAHIETNVPVYCLHAILVTYNGVKKLWDILLNLSIGVYAIDNMIRHAIMCCPKNKLTTYVWNVASFFPCPEKNMLYDWTRRNNGLVFQDDSFGTDVDKRLIKLI